MSVSRWISTTEAARRLGVSPQAIRNRVVRGELSSKRVESTGGRSSILVSETAVESLQGSNTDSSSVDRRLRSVEEVLSTVLHDGPLREVIRSQAIVIEALNEVVRRQVEASRYTALAEIERTAALQALERAHAEEALLIATHGLPDVQA